MLQMNELKYEFADEWGIYKSEFLFWQIILRDDQISNWLTIE